MLETAQSGVLGCLQGEVLLVDDDESVRQLTAMVLRRAGLKVEMAADGLEALSRLEAQPHDLLVIDCNLPAMNGLSVVREWRRREKLAGGSRVPVVVMTGDPGRTDEAVCLAAGADGFLAKPVGIPGLMEVIERLLGAE